MKKKRFQILMWVSMAVWFGGLIVMLAGLLYDENLQSTLGMVLLFVGIGMFIGGIALTCVAAVLDRKRIKKEIAALPEDTVPLNALGAVAQFTDEGFVVPWAGAFPDDKRCIPYDEIKLYRVTCYSSPRAKGKELILMEIPFGEDMNFGSPEGRLMLAMNEKAVRLAERHGVSIVEKNEAPAQERTLLKKFVYREAGRIKGAVFMTALAVGVAAAAVGIGVWIQLSTGGSSGSVSGIGGGIVAVIVMNAANLYRGTWLKVYSDGIYMCMSGGHGNVGAGKRFLPVGQIEKIFRTQIGIAISIGCEVLYFPEVFGLWEELQQRFPEQCKADDDTMSEDDGAENI